MKTKKQILTGGLFLSTLLISSIANAVTLTTSPSKDAVLYDDGVNGSFGGGSSMVFGKNGDGDEVRAIMAFDVSSIPAGATVSSVTLTGHVLQIGQQGGIPTSPTAHKVSSDWGEGSTSTGGGQQGGGKGGVTSAGGVTWNHSASPTTWTAGGDFVAGTSATAPSVGAGGAVVWSGAGMVADVQSWVDTPGTNFGWIIQRPGSTGFVAQIASLQNSTVGDRPSLEVIYTAPVPSPLMGSPVAWIALLFGFAGIGTRKILAARIKD